MKNGKTEGCSIQNRCIINIRQHHPGGTRRVRHGRAEGAFRPVLDGAGSLQRGDGEHRQRAWHKDFFHAERRAAGGDGRYKGADARRIGLPRQEVPHRESEAESRVQGDALRQRAIIRLTNHRVQGDALRQRAIIRLTNH